MLKGLVALVTGGAGSLGLATTKKLVSEGLKVVMLDLPSSQGNALAKEIGKDVVFSPGDISSEEDVIKAMDLSKSKFDKLDVVVNCAGTSMARTIYNFNRDTKINLDEIKNYVNINLVGTLNVVRCGAEAMAKNTPDQEGLRGLIINTSGFAAFDGQTGQVVPAAVWGGISSITQPLCRDLSPIGIRVVTISPGLMQSKLTDILPHKMIEHLAVVTPGPKRLGKAEEYAHLVASIIGNPFINGEVIRLDGGLRFYLY